MGRCPPKENSQDRQPGKSSRSARVDCSEGARWPKNRVLSRYEVSTDSWAGRDWWSLQPLRMPTTAGRSEHRIGYTIQLISSSWPGLEAKALQP